MTVYMYVYLVYITCLPRLSPSSCSIVPDIVVGAFEIGSRSVLGSHSGVFLVREKGEYF